MQIDTNDLPTVVLCVHRGLLRRERCEYSENRSVTHEERRPRPFIASILSQARDLGIVRVLSDDGALKMNAFK
jgi:hypothetical protein